MKELLHYFFINNILYTLLSREEMRIQTFWLSTLLYFYIISALKESYSQHEFEFFWIYDI